MHSRVRLYLSKYFRLIKKKQKLFCTLDKHLFTYNHNLNLIRDFQLWKNCQHILVIYNYVRQRHRMPMMNLKKKKIKINFIPFYWLFLIGWLVKFIFILYVVSIDIIIYWIIKIMSWTDFEINIDVKQFINFISENVFIDHAFTI